jgi:hypothetical protein
MLSIPTWLTVLSYICGRGGEASHGAPAGLLLKTDPRWMLGACSRPHRATKCDDGRGDLSPSLGMAKWCRPCGHVCPFWDLWSFNLKVVRQSQQKQRGLAGPRFPDKSAHEGQHENAPASHGMPNHLRASSCSDQTLLRWKTDLSENQGQRRSEDDGREVWDAQRKPQETCRFKGAPSSGRWGSSLWGESFGQSR